MYYFCNTHRCTTEHLPDGKGNMLCIGWREHVNISWCNVCGARLLANQECHPQEPECPMKGRGAQCSVDGECLHLKKIKQQLNGTTTVA